MFKFKFSLIIITILVIAACIGVQHSKAASTEGGQIQQTRNVKTANAQTVIQDFQFNSQSVGPANCPAEHFIDVQAHPANAAYPAPQLNVTCNTNTFIVQSNGIPNFEFTQVTPNALQAQNYRWEIPLNPQIAATPSDIPLLGPAAVTVTGLPIFGPNEAPQDNYGDPYLDGLLDYCNGHTAQRGIYHFHARPGCIFENIDGNVGLVIGYAFDGFPILAPYICEDEACSLVKEVQSSWQRTSDVRNAWDAHKYVAGSGDLDQCNGLEFADGSYAYFATDTFPYFMGCYRGTATVSGGPGGPPQGEQNGAPQGQPLQNNQNGLQGQPPQIGQNDLQGQPPQNRQNGLQGQSPQNGQNGPQGQPPQGGQLQGNGPTGGRPDLANAARQLGISEQQLREALGPPPPDLAAAAAKLGISQDVLRQVLGIPVR